MSRSNEAHKNSLPPDVANRTVDGYLKLERGTEFHIKVSNNNAHKVDVSLVLGEEQIKGIWRVDAFDQIYIRHKGEVGPERDVRKFKLIDEEDDAEGKEGGGGFGSDAIDLRVRRPHCVSCGGVWCGVCTQS